MKKFFTSKPFVISALAVLCIGIVAACLIWGRDKPSEFTPDPQESQTTDEWKDNSSSGNGAESWNTPGGAENQPDVSASFHHHTNAPQPQAMPDEASCHEPGKSGKHAVPVERNRATTKLMSPQP